MAAASPCGSVSGAASTLEKAAAREAVRASVIAQLQPLLEAQLALAQGLKYLVVRNAQTGTVLRVSDAMAEATLRKDEEIIEVWEKTPNVQALLRSAHVSLRAMQASAHWRMPPT